jgi:hypothetical protein
VFFMQLTIECFYLKTSKKGILGGSMCALVHRDCSSFRALYNSSHDQSFITFTGLDY